MRIEAKYLRTVKGYADYQTTVDGKTYGVGGLPKRVNGQRVTWTKKPNSPDYVASVI